MAGGAGAGQGETVYRTAGICRDTDQVLTGSGAKGQGLSEDRPHDGKERKTDGRKGRGREGEVQAEPGTRTALGVGCQIARRGEVRIPAVC